MSGGIKFKVKSQKFGYSTRGFFDRLRMSGRKSLMKTAKGSE
jgi:hypothetical protein